MSTHLLIVLLLPLFLVVVLLPAGLGAPELVALLLITVALFSVWRWRRHRANATA